MTTDDDLHQLLETAAQAYEPPADGAARVLQQTRPQAEPVSRTPSLAHRWPGALLAAVSVVGVLVALAFGLQSGSGSRGSSSGRASSGGSAPLGAARNAPAPAAAPTPTTLRPKGSSVPGQAARVVQTGQVALQVPPGQVPTVLDRLGGIASSLGGYVAQSRSDDAGRSDQGSATPSGTTTLRVPVAGYPAALAQARGAGRVTSASSEARDVTGDYVDLGARISALQQTRSTYLTLLSKATNIGDTLSVQQRVQDVQTQIEQLQGQQKLLADTSDLATLTLTVTEAGSVLPAPHSTGGFGAALHRAVAGFTGGLQALIAVSGPVLFALLLLGALAALGRVGYRILQRRLL